MGEVELVKEEFCECCGEKVCDIKNRLKISDKPQTKTINDGKHTLSISGHVYPNNLQLNYCVHCGAKLEEEDIRTTTEFMGMFGMSRACQTIVTGYTCPKCGVKEEF